MLRSYFECDCKRRVNGTECILNRVYAIANVVRYVKFFPIEMNTRKSKHAKMADIRPRLAADR